MNKSLRGAANIRQFNAEREATNVLLIKDELKKARRLKLEFKTLGKLAEFLGDRTGIHRTSLTRNVRYKVMLVNYLATTRGHLINVPDSKASPEILRAKLLASQLESSNLQKKLTALEAAASSLATLPKDQEENLASSDQSYLAFVDTAMTLTAVLERMQGTVRIDTENRTIEDLAAPPSERVIVGPERATAYIRWRNKQAEMQLQFNGGGFKTHRKKA